VAQEPFQRIRDEFLSFIRREFAGLASIRSYCSQVRLFSQTDLYKSAAGTGINHNIFLPNGSVVINLGTLAHLYEFIENDRMLASCDSTRALSHPGNNSFRGYDHRIEILLIMKVLKLLTDLGSLPVPPVDNLCPVSRAFLGYCNDVMCRCTQFIQNTFDL
jgi:hypothetical protein